MLWLLAAGCSYKVAQIESVSGGAVPGEFYVLTTVYTYDAAGMETLERAILRCYDPADGIPACRRVLDQPQALAAAQSSHRTILSVPGASGQEAGHSEQSGPSSAAYAVTARIYGDLGLEVDPSSPEWHRDLAVVAEALKGQSASELITAVKRGAASLGPGRTLQVYIVEGNRLAD